MTDKLIFLDTETNGTENPGSICQIAYRRANDPEVRSSLFKTIDPITIDAMVVNGITNKSIANKELFKDSKYYSELENWFNNEDCILVAHNAKFDYDQIYRDGLRPKQYICTMKVAQVLDTEGIIPKYAMQYLRYYLDLQDCEDALAHDAIGDIIVLEALFKRLAAKISIKEMVAISMTPQLLKKIPFGKYKGQFFKDVDKSYLHWCINNMSDLRDDAKYTIEHYLKN